MEFPVCVLRARALQRQDVVAKYLAILCRGRGPGLPDRTPGISEALFVRVPVLRNDRGDSIGLTHRQREAGWRAIVEHIKCEAVELERLREGMYGQRQSSKRVTIVSFRRDLGESETRKVRRDHVVIIGETRNEITEHER